MGKKTPLYDCHLAANAKMVEFAGWEMPLQYTSQLQEHHQVRLDCGVFDVSHMTIVDLTGPDTLTFLSYLLANNIAKLQPGKGLYSCMLNHDGKILDDLIAYQITVNSFRLIVNSATRDKDLNWIKSEVTPFNVTVSLRDDLCMLALQGKKIRDKLNLLFPQNIVNKVQNLKPFEVLAQDDLFIACTGYTGEDGFEIILPAGNAHDFWQTVLAADIKPCGLGARDTLRLEAGLNLYGTDMDETTTPLETNLAWTVAFEPANRNFIGRAALEKNKKAGMTQKLVGLVLDGPGVLRNHQKVIFDNGEEGETTSGSFSPTLNRGIALARIPFISADRCWVEVRGKKLLAHIVKPPFVKHGEQTFRILTERENE